MTACGDTQSITKKMIFSFVRQCLNARKNSPPKRIKQLIFGFLKIKMANSQKIKAEKVIAASSNDNLTEKNASDSFENKYSQRTMEAASFRDNARDPQQHLPRDASLKPAQNDFSNRPRQVSASRKRFGEKEGAICVSFDLDFPTIKPQIVIPLVIASDNDREYYQDLRVLAEDVQTSDERVFLFMRLDSLLEADRLTFPANAGSDEYITINKEDVMCQDELVLPMRFRVIDSELFLPLRLGGLPLEEAQLFPVSVLRDFNYYQLEVDMADHFGKAHVEVLQSDLLVARRILSFEPGEVRRGQSEIVLPMNVSLLRISDSARVAMPVESDVLRLQEMFDHMGVSGR